MPVEKRILIVDDEKRMADSLKSLFDASGYCADVAYSGTEAKAKIAEQDYPLIITDIKMPDCDGYEVMRFIHEKSPNSLVIVITAYASTESAIEAIHQSAFDYIPKPYEFEDLRHAVERAFYQLETRQMREDLISMITHDIKVPLGTIIGYAQMALEGEGGRLHPRAPEFLELISMNAQRVLSLLDNFLTTCRVEAGRLEIAELPVDLAEVVEDVRPISELEARKRGIHLHVRIDSDECTIVGDSNLLFRALGNLFHNAVKYADEGGRVEAALRVVEREEQGERKRWALFEISNTGRGISPDALPHIFDRYARVGESGREGAGLGLYVVRCIIEAHHGHVEAESRPGDKTIFRVYLPLAEAAATDGQDSH